MTGSDDQKTIEAKIDLMKSALEMARNVEEFGGPDALPPDWRALYEATKDQVELTVDPPGSPVLMVKRMTASRIQTMFEAGIDPSCIRTTIRGIVERVLPDFSEDSRPLLVTHIEAAMDDVLGPEADRRPS